MKRRVFFRRLLAMALSAAMVLGGTPVAAAGVQYSVMSGEITAFEPLAEDVVNQTVSLGTSIDELNLPNTLKVTVTGSSIVLDVSRKANDLESGSREETEADKSVIVADTSGGDIETGSNAQEPKESEKLEKSEESQDTPEKFEATVAVSGWESTTNYDMDEADIYTFSPVLELPEGLTLGEGVKTPSITVTVTNNTVTGSPIPVVGRAPVASMASGTGWSLNSNGVLTISSNAGMTDWAANGRNANVKSVVSAVIADGVTNISTMAFYGGSQLTSITIPDSVASIGHDVFYQCTKLTSVTIPEGVTAIDSNTFYQCTSLTSVTIPEGVTSIGMQAFALCKALVSIGIPNSVTSIGYGAFNTTGLATVDIPEGVTTIGQAAFANCTGLTTVAIPAGVTSFGRYALANCTSLKTVTFEGAPPTVGDNIFTGCSSLTAIYVPSEYVEKYKTATNLTVYADLITAGTSGIESEQFDLPVGETYYFDLSNEAGNVGKANTELPDTSLHYVPFTYAGTVNAYSLDAAQATTEEYATTNTSHRSLFVANYNLGYSSSWDILDSNGLIFGKAFGSDYKLRSLSVGSSMVNGQGSPASNEWDAILDKNEDYIKNWQYVLSWGQDTMEGESNIRTVRAYYSVRDWDGNYSNNNAGFRPALEVLSSDERDSDELKAVTLDLNGGYLGGSADDITIVSADDTYTAPGSTGLTRPSSNTGSYFSWNTAEDGSGTAYAPEAEVPNTVTTLYAQWIEQVTNYTITLNANGGSVTPTTVETMEGTLADLPTPTRSGYTFDGWFTAAEGGNEVTDSTEFTANATIYAHWTVVVTNYTITLNANGGSVTPTTVKTMEGTLADLPTPTRSGYTFDGWFTAAEGGNEVTDTTEFTANATIYAHWTVVVTNYTITLNANGGSVALTTMETREGTLADLPTPTRDGYTFNGWFTAAEGGNEVTDNTEFTANATIYAHWTLVVTNYTITLNANGGSVTLTTMETREGTLADLPTPTRSGYTFAGWFTAAEGGNEVTDTTEFAADATIYAHWTVNSGGSGGSSGSSGGSDNGNSNGGNSSSGSRPEVPATGSTENKATVDSKGNASVSITDKNIMDAIADAKSAAVKNGKSAGEITLSINIPTGGQTANAIIVNLPKTAQQQVISNKIAEVELNIEHPDILMVLNNEAITEINRQANADVQLTAAKTDSGKLGAAAKKAIESRPAYDFKAIYQEGKGNVSVFGKGSIFVSIPYTPANNEKIEYLHVVYVDSNGSVSRVPGSAYDVNTQSLIFTTNHFSVYGVSYTDPTAQMTDVSSHWAKDSIYHVVGRGLLEGTSATKFSPDADMTRGMLVMALGRLANVDTKAYTTNSFKDVKADSAFRPYIEWAYKNGIIQGTGNGKFEPARAITREKIAVIFANYAKATGYTLPVTRKVTTYTDASSIGSTYKTAVTALQQAGIMMGGSGKKFNPKSNATRAEVSTMLHRYIKLTINPDTAQGWAINDAGQYLYYKDSKSLISTQTIGNVKYFFHTNGTLKTGWVKDGDNWRFYSGNTMLVGFWDLGANGSNKTYYFAKDGIMIAGKWLEINTKWYYFNADGSLAKSTKIDGHEVDANGVRKD